MTERPSPLDLFETYLARPAWPGRRRRTPRPRPDLTRVRGPALPAGSLPFFRMRRPADRSSIAVKFDPNVATPVAANSGLYRCRRTRTFGVMQSATNVLAGSVHGGVGTAIVLLVEAM